MSRASCLEKVRLVTRMRVALLAGYEPCPHHHSRRAGDERSAGRDRIGDTSGGQQWQRHGAADLRQQRQQPDDALQITASLNALHDQRVSTGFYRRARASSAEATCTKARAPPA